jgi:hypothetical protein
VLFVFALTALSEVAAQLIERIAATASRRRRAAVSLIASTALSAVIVIAAAVLVAGPALRAKRHSRNLHILLRQALTD